jgi:GT2 family glycosyltransferase
VRLERQLAALRRQSLPRDAFEVLVVDDGSSDATPDVLRHEAAVGELPLTVLRHDTPRGPAVARNTGWRAAGAPLIAFTDDDCEAQPGWLEALLAAYDRDDGRLIQGRTSPIAAELPLLGPFAYTIEVDGVTPESQTCNIAYPRAVLERLGGFDESFRGPQGEDVDLGWRARAIGIAPVFAPGAHVEHAVMELGAAETLRRAWRWSPAMRPFARHPELRRERLHKGLFWNWTHYLLLRALLALPLLRRSWGLPVAVWLARPLVAYELEKGRKQGRRSLALFWLTHDVIETAAVVRGAVHYRTLVI